MCIQDSEQMNEGIETLDISNNDDNFKNQSLHSEAEFQHTQNENLGKNNSSSPSVMRDSFPVRFPFLFFF